MLRAQEVESQNADPADKVKQDIDQVKRKMRTARQDIPADFNRDADMFRDNFTPGYAITRRTIAVNVAGLLTGIIWFSVFFSIIYKDDRQDRNSDVTDDEKATMLFGLLNKGGDYRTQ